MDVVDKFYSGYGEGAPRGKGPNQGLIQARGNAYLEKDFPLLSYFSSVKFLWILLWKENIIKLEFAK